MLLNDSLLPARSLYLLLRLLCFKWGNNSVYRKRPGLNGGNLLLENFNMGHLLIPQPGEKAPGHRVGQLDRHFVIKILVRYFLVKGLIKIIQRVQILFHLYLKIGISLYMVPRRGQRHEGLSRNVDVQMRHFCFYLF